MQRRNVWLATTLLNHRVRNNAGENLGKLEDLVIDPDTGTIRYGVLSFGGILGMGDRLFAIPWSALSISPPHDYLLLNVHKRRLETAPGFDRGHWPDMGDPAWQQHIHDYYIDTAPVQVVHTTAATAPAQVVRERTAVYTGRPRQRRGAPVLATILALCLLFGLIWVGYLVSTRGWEQARQDISTTVQGAAYAAKETSQDAALTAKVKTALSLSKRIPSGDIHIDSDNDVVTLRGEVPNDEVRNLAEQIARDVPGVREVQNHVYAVSHSQ
jgi:osmotically-inducible protein OsmY/sporulation protein YlmC with PRC-barrel domain